MNIAELFNHYASDYEADRPKLIPHFHEFYGALLDQVPCPADAQSRILDLGAGTGLVTALLTAKLPLARFTLVDIAEQMLAQARARFANSNRHEFRAMNYLELDEQNHYDAVVSALSIHHLADADKAALYQKIHRALKPGGRFINADQVLAPTPDLEREYHAHWLAHLHNSGNTEEKIAAALLRVSADRNAPLSAQLDWLSAAGFINVDCWFKSNRFAVFGGQKPSTR